MDGHSPSLLAFLATIFVLVFALSVALMMVRKRTGAYLNKAFPGGNFTGRISRNMNITLGPDGAADVRSALGFEAGGRSAFLEGVTVDAIDRIRMTDRERERYLSQWRAAQDRFERNPAEAVREASELLSRLLPEGATMSMPMTQARLEGDDIRKAFGVVDEMRQIVRSAQGAARAIAAVKEHREASVSDLTLAMEHYRMIFDRLLGDSLPQSDGTGTR